MAWCFIGCKGAAPVDGSLEGRGCWEAAAAASFPGAADQPALLLLAALEPSDDMTMLVLKMSVVKVMAQDVHA